MWNSALAAVPHYLHSISPYEDIVSSENMHYCNELGGGRHRLDSNATDVGLSGFPKEQQTHSCDGIWWFND